MKVLKIIKYPEEVLREVLNSTTEVSGSADGCYWPSVCLKTYCLEVLF